MTSVPAREISFAFVDDLIFVAGRPVHSASDVESIAKRGFRSVICVNEHLRDAAAYTYTDALKSKNIQYMSGETALTELVDNGSAHVEKFTKDINESKFDKLVSLMDIAPRPTLVVSFMPSSNNAALALVYAYIGTRMTKTDHVKNLPTDLRQFLETYLETKINRILGRLPTQKYEGGIWYCEASMNAI
jgi:protein tyrosine phosphatase (PTP) superfamily phosphohydrolase (DUF442 family)